MIIVLKKRGNYIRTAQHKERQRFLNQGKIMSETVKSKISIALSGRKHVPMSKVTKDRISASKKGVKHSHKRVYKNRYVPWNKNLKGVQVGWNKGMFGELSKNYIHDRSKIKKSDRREDALFKEWRLKVYKRDNWQCKIENADCCGRIEAHHILPWRSHVNLRYKVNNGITLCHFHHPIKRSEESRLSPYFQELILKK